MAKAAQEPETEVLETPETPETPEIDEIDEAEQPEAPEAEDPETPDEPEAEEEETIIGFGDEDEDELAEQDGESTVIKRFRERDRERTKQLREKDREIAELRQAATPKKVGLGPEPTLEDCDFDEEVLKTRLREYDAKKKEVEAEQATEQQKYNRVIESYNRDLEAYNTRKAAIGVPDYEEAEATVVAALSMEQQAVAIQAANDPAALVVALAKSPAKLAELAKIDNPWKLSAAIAKLEGSVKVVTRKKGPNIDRPAKGSASMVQANADEKLAQLEKEAEKTGNRTELIAYKRSLRAQGK